MENLLVNPTLTLDVNENGIADGWATVHFAGGSAVPSVQRDVEPLRGQRFDVTNPTSTNNGGARQDVFTGWAEGDRLGLSYRHLLVAGAVGAVFVQIDFRTAADERIAEVSETIASLGLGKLTPIQIEGTVPATTGIVRCNILSTYTVGQNATVILRDARLAPVSAYFLPPVKLMQPRPWRVPGVSGKYRALLRYFVSEDIEIGGVTYRGASWAGPLSAAEQAAIQAAGHGARIREVFETGLLPATID